ncbi:hypothetical protein EPO17_01970 [Patescibacteria group bacterium]|nr:MAG: hypothetical protein EPO17_01970 [Patescibacteria group bacterium]
MNIKKQSAIALVVLVVILIGVYVQYGRSALSSDVVVVGSSLSLTGKSASIGERVKNGMEIALAEVQASSTLPIKLKVVYEDDKGEAPAAVSAVNKLISSDRVHVIIGLPKSDPLLAIAPITEKHKVVVFSPTAGAEGITDAGDYVFRNIQKPDSDGKTIAGFFKNRGVNKVALFVAQASNALSYGKAFKNNFEAVGGTISFDQQYNQDSTDFRTDILRAKKSGAEAVYLAVATGKDSGIITRQLREAGFAGMIAASVASQTKEFLDTAGIHAEGVYVTTAYFDPNNPIAREYARAYKARTGAESDGFGANSYDAIMLIAKAVNECKGDDSDCIRDYLYHTRNYPGVGGITTFDQNGDVTKLAQIMVVKGGMFVRE